MGIGLKNTDRQNGKFILRFDDVSPGMAWKKFLPFKKVVNDLGIRSVLGVVPECRDPLLQVEPDRSDFFERAREWAEWGDAIAQHGTFHLYDSKQAGMLGLQTRSEFAGHPYVIQLDRISRGKEILNREGIWQPYFMAPSHSFDHITLRALRDLKFVAITDGFGFYPYHVNGLLFVPQLVARPLNVAFGIQTICVHINHMSESAIQELLMFIVTNKRKFVDFKDVVSGPVRHSVWRSLLRMSTTIGVKAVRRLRAPVVRIKNFSFLS